MRSRLCDILCRHGLLDATGVARVRDGLDDPGGLAARLVTLGLVDEDILVSLLAEECTLPVVDPRTAAVPAEAVAAVPHGLARRHQLVPVALEGALLTIAMVDPTDQGAVAQVTFLTGLDVQAAVAPPSAVRDAIVRLYGEAPELADALSGLGPALPEERAPAQRQSDVSPRRSGEAPATCTSSPSTARSGSGCASTASSPRSPHLPPASPLPSPPA
jgi:hypothetical protein